MDGYPDTDGFDLNPPPLGGDWVAWHFALIRLPGFIGIALALHLVPRRGRQRPRRLKGEPGTPIRSARRQHSRKLTGSGSGQSSAPISRCQNGQSLPGQLTARAAPGRPQKAPPLSDIAMKNRHSQASARSGFVGGTDGYHPGNRSGPWLAD